MQRLRSKSYAFFAALDFFPDLAVVGDLVGFKVGYSVGLKVGDSVGLTVGCSVGLTVGWSVGWRVGFIRDSSRKK